ncbi:rod-binding protein [Vampirovibrio sp.]|uniref:rod-binding protein n=1 Tax=Vampirovibrio sp. TaxID=2717857 RepID=UPI0035947F93
MSSMDFNLQAGGGTQWQGQSQATKLQNLQRQYLNPDNQDQKKLKKAAQEFEAIFVQQMLDAMDKTVDRKDSFLNGGSSEEYFRSMLNEEISKSMTSRQGGSGFGLAESIYRQMSKEASKKDGQPQSVQGTNGEVTP